MFRVQKLLSNYGYCSRRKAEELIIAGKVKVNGKTIKIGDQAEETDEITVDNKAIQKERKVYLVFNKPLNCVTALTDQKMKTVMDYIKIKERVFPIGRLDYNTSGLLLLTNDGDFANRIMHPRYEIKKTYLVRLDKDFTVEAIKQVEKGLALDDGKTSPGKVRRIADTFIEITIHEGKNRIIRRIMAELDYKVLSLERVGVGNLRLFNLKPGEYRQLTRKEMEKIFR